MAKKIGFVMCPEFRRLPVHEGALCACAELLPKPNFIVGSSAGSIAGAACLPWTEANFKRQGEIIKNLKTKQIYNIPRSTELLGLLVALAPILPFIKLNEGRSRWKRLTVNSFEAAFPLALDAVFVRQFLKKKYIFSNEPLRRLLLEGSDSQKGLDFEAIFNSDIKLEILATNMLTGEEVVFSNKTARDQDKCRFTDAILASARLSGRFPPQVIDGMVLGDAAIRGSMPIHRAVNAGCDVIFVFLYTPFQEERPEPQNWIGDISRANQITESEVAKLTYENYLLRRIAGEELPEVFIIRTNEKLPELNFREFSSDALVESMNIGYRAVKAQLPIIQKLLE